jgi:hypothetical protein
MTRRISWLFVALAFGAVAAPAPAADMEPTVVLRVRSLESLAEDARYLADLLGQADAFKDVDAKLRELKGIDLKKPFGAYAFLSPGIVDSGVVVLVPVTDEKAFVALLGNFGFVPEKDKDGVYSLSVPPVPFPFYFRVANGYANITVQSKDNLDKTKLLPPAKVLPAGQKEVLVASLRFDHVPNEIKQLAISQIDLRLPELLEQKQPNETEAQHKLKVAVGKELASAITSLLRDCREIRLALDLNRSAHSLTYQLSVDGAANSELAKNIAAAGKAPSLFAGLLDSDAAFSLGLNLTVPESVSKSLVSVLDEAIRKDLEKETDAVKKTLVTRLFKALEPTLKAGRLQTGSALRGPSAAGRYTAISGARIQDGAGLERALRDIVRELPAEVRAQITLDHSKAGAANIHRITPKNLPDQPRQILGDEPFYAALTADAIYVAAGEGGLNALKQALTLKPGAVSLVQAEVSVSRIIGILDTPNREKIQSAARKVFQGADKASDRLRFAVEGGDALKIRLEMNTKVLKFLHEAGGAPGLAP